MAANYARSIESPCRNCENVHANKEECSRVVTGCGQDAILRNDEASIKHFVEVQLFQGLKIETVAA